MLNKLEHKKDKWIKEIAESIDIKIEYITNKNTKIEEEEIKQSYEKKKKEILNN